MKKICIILLIIFILSVPTVSFAEVTESYRMGDTGDGIAQLQTWLRWLGYFNYRTTGRFSELTEEAVMDFQVQNGITATGAATIETQNVLYSSSAKRAPQNKAFVSVYGKRTVYPTEFGKIELWENVSQIFTVGTTAEVKDLYSNASFSVVRTGGENNAVVTPSTKNDADTFISMCGGSSTWEKRPVKVTVNGMTYAASIFCSLNYPDDTENGLTQIYFSKSTSDLFGISDAEMDTSVLKAAGEIKE